MRVLVLDTALGACTVGLFQDGQVVALRHAVMARGHAERLGGFARDVAAEAGGFGGLDRIGVTVGPGSFTGLRVGLAFALGLGAALERPVIGLSTLQALAASAGGEAAEAMEAGLWTDEAVASVIDARRGEVYLQGFVAGDPVGPPRALEVAAARTWLFDARPDWRGVGDGARLVLDPERIVGPQSPSAAALARLTARLDPAAHPPRPLYLRAPDATPPTRLPGQARLAPAPR